MNEEEPETWENLCKALSSIGIQVIENDDIAVARTKRFTYALGPSWKKPSLGIHHGRALWVYGGFVYAEKLKPEEDKTQCER